MIPEDKVRIEILKLTSRLEIRREKAQAELLKIINDEKLQPIT